MPFMQKIFNTNSQAQHLYCLKLFLYSFCIYSLIECLVKTAPCYFVLNIPQHSLS